MSVVDVTSTQLFSRTKKILEINADTVRSQNKNTFWHGIMPNNNNDRKSTLLYLIKLINFTPLFKKSIRDH